MVQDMVMPNRRSRNLARRSQQRTAAQQEAERAGSAGGQTRANYANSTQGLHLIGRDDADHQDLNLDLTGYQSFSTPREVESDSQTEQQEWQSLSGDDPSFSDSASG